MIIFVSYSSRDLALVEPLVLQLGTLGYHVHFEQKALTGEIRWKQVFDSIREADFLVLAVTEHSLRSSSRLLELDYARSLGKPILSVVLANMYTEIPPTFYPVVDYRHRNAETNRMLAHTLEHIVRNPPSEAQSFQPGVPDWLTPLTTIRHQIASGYLSPEVQHSILLNLREFMERQETCATAEALLDAFAAYRQLDPAVRRDVQRIQRRVHKNYTAQRRSHWRSMVLGSVLLSMLILVPVFLLAGNRLFGKDEVSITAQATEKAIVRDNTPTASTTPPVTRSAPTVSSGLGRASRTATRTPALTSVPAATISAAPSASCTVISGGDYNSGLRSGPGLDFPLLTWLVPGDELILNGQVVDDEGFTWFRAENNIHWVRSDVVWIIEGTCEDLPEVSR